MSLFEVLIAAALLLVIALGILALLTRAVANNNQGWEATASSNYVRNQLDTNMGQPLGVPSMEIAPGSTELTGTSYWSPGASYLMNDDDEGWYDTEPTSLMVLLTKERTVRQYNVKSLVGEPTGYSDSGEREYTIPESRLESGLDGSSDSTFVHVKRVELTIIGQRAGGPLGAGQRLRSETYKSF